MSSRFELSPADEARVRALREVDPDAAFRQLFTALRAPVYRLCLHLTGSELDAEDALQDTFLSVHRALPRFRGDAALATWVYRIAVHASFKVRGRVLQRGEAVPEGAQPPRGEASADAQRVLAAMQRLSVDHRVVLSLFAIDGLRHGEIAQVLGIPEGTVWSRLHLARKRLHTLLEPARG